MLPKCNQSSEIGREIAEESRFSSGRFFRPRHPCFGFAAGSWAIVADRDRGQRGPERMVSIPKRFPDSAATPAAVDIIGKPGAG
jgi:hypothetical protein